MPELARFEARGRARLDEATVVGSSLVDAARKRTGLGAVERAAARAVVFHEAKPRRACFEHGVFSEEDLTESLLVRLEQVHRTGSVMAAPTARHAVGPVRIRGAFKTHDQLYDMGVARGTPWPAPALVLRFRAHEEALASSLLYV